MTKKTGTKSSARKKTVRKSPARKSTAKKKSAASAESASHTSAKKKKKHGHRGRKKRGRTAAEKRADEALRPTRRKPTSGGKAAKKEILDFFASDNLAILNETELNERKMVFLRAYANKGIVRDGLVAAGVSWKAYASWQKNDEAFSEGCRHAENMAADRLEAEAIRRGRDGYAKPIIYKGEITGEYTEYSDSLLQTVLKGHKPKRYKDRTEHSTPPGQPLQMETKESRDDVMATLLGMINSKENPE